MTSKIAYRPEIDGLRAVAVAAVMLFHLSVPGLTGGFVGVDVFFVISGYLITQIIWNGLSDGNFSLRGFYAGRARRLLPALFAVMALTFVASALLLTPLHFAWMGSSMAAAAMSISNVQFWREAGYFDIYAQYKPLLHTWSLSVEGQFYAVWPFVLLAIYKLGRSGKAALAVIVVAGIASLVANLVWIEQTNDLFFLPQFRVYEFCIGAAVSFAPRSLAVPQWVRELLVAAGLAAILLAVLTFRPNASHPGYEALLPCLGTGLVILAGFGSRAGRLLGASPLVYVGKLSYSLYLTHWPVIVLYKYWRFGEASPAEMCGVAALAVVLAMVLHHFVEQPFRRRKAKHGVIRGTAMAGVALLAVWAGVSAGSADGWTWRLSRTTSPAVLAARDMPKCQGAFGLCGSSSGARWFLIGDSHSNVLQRYAAASIAAQGLVLEQMPALPACIAVFDNALPCEGAMNDDLKAVETSGDAQGVFLFSNWNPMTHFESADFVVDHVAETVGKFTSAGIKVVVNGSMPFMPQDPAICTNRPLAGGCPVRMVPVNFADQRTFNSRLRAAVEGNGGTFIDFMALLCSETDCPVSVDSLGLYGDRYHFSTLINDLLLIKEFQVSGAKPAIH